MIGRSLARVLSLVAFVLASVAVANAKVAPFSIVSVDASTPLAFEPGDGPGVFTISRAGDTNASFTLNFSLTGTASNGVDYQTVSTAVTFEPGQLSTNVIITPLANSSKGHKSVILSLAGSDSWRTATNGFIVGFFRRAELFVAYGYTNVPPTVSIVSPSNGASYLSLPNIWITADAGDSNGWVTSVQFFANGAAIGTSSNWPSFTGPAWRPIDRHSHFSFLWTGVAAGNYALRAVATDNAGLQTTSAVVNITVTTNLPTPEVRIVSPFDGAQFPIGFPINIFAAAGETNGVISTVEFIANGASIGAITNSEAGKPWFHESFRPVLSPFIWRWTNAPAGSNSLVVIATDANGSQATSSTVNINIVTNSVHHHHSGW